MLTEFYDRWKTAELVKMYYEAEASKTVVLPSQRQSVSEELKRDTCREVIKCVIKKILVSEKRMTM